MLKFKNIYIYSTERSLFSENIWAKTTNNMKIFIHLHMNKNKISKSYNKINKNQISKIKTLKNLTTFIRNS